jgi:hypothetical protein
MKLLLDENMRRVRFGQLFPNRLCGRYGRPLLAPTPHFG